MASIDIAVAAHTPLQGAEAEKLAASLNLPLAGPEQQYQLLLRCGNNGLALIKQGDPNLKGPVRVDFIGGQSAYRRRQQKRELLVRAVGYKPTAPPAVVDGTGGLGRDSFILAAAGCQVRIFEREPIIAALLADGLQRALDHPETAEIARRICLHNCDTISALQGMQQRGEPVDVVYLDPMFPERQKTARVKKELQILQILAGENTPPDRLMEAALATAAQRVVVKRPRRSPCLTNLHPSHSLSGKTIRFDVYLTGMAAKKR